MRQVVLDTETTGLEPRQGHRIIEIGCVEIVNRRVTKNHYHQYIQPDREIDEGALAVHGISSEFLADKPRFADIVEDFIKFIDGAELLIHNAPFDVGFIDHELNMLGSQWGGVGDRCTVTDTLVMARRMHPGQKASLDALCKRYNINNAHRELHGALLDAELLAEVYLGMTGGQVMLSLDDHSENGAEGSAVAESIRRVGRERPAIAVIKASQEELEAHQAWVKKLGEQCLWKA